MRETVPQSVTGQEPNGGKLKCYNRADDGLRTRDLQLGKLALYQLSYVRASGYFNMPETALSLP